MKILIFILQKKNQNNNNGNNNNQSEFNNVWATNKTIRINVVNKSNNNTID